MAQVAARALGSIGGPAVEALERAMSADPPATRLAVYEGLLRCAETLPGPRAAAVYDKLRTQPNLPYHLHVAALGGAIRSRGPAGVPLMIEAIGTGSPVAVPDTLRISGEVPGPEVTRALVGALGDADEENQVLLLNALGERGDATAASALVALARAERQPPCRDPSMPGAASPGCVASGAVGPARGYRAGRGRRGAGRIGRVARPGSRSRGRGRC